MMSGKGKQRAQILVKTGFVHVFGAGTLNKIVSFSSSIIIVRILTQTEYGIYSYVMNLISIFMLTNGLGTLTGVLQYGSELRQGDEPLKAAYYNYGSRIGFCFNTLLFFIIVIYAAFGAEKFPGTRVLFLLAALIPVATYLFDNICMRLRADLKNQAFGFLNSFCTVSIFLCILWGAYADRAAGAIYFRYIALAASSLLGIALLKRYKERSCRTRVLNPEQKREFMKFCGITSINNAISHLLYTIDIFLIGMAASDPGMIASYKVATVIPFGLSFIPTAIVTYIYPYFARHNSDKDWIMKKVKSLILMLAIANGVITGILLLFSGRLIQILFGAQYEDSILCFRILVCGYFISGTFRIILGNVLDMLREVKSNFYISIITGGMNIVLDYVLIRQFGAAGAAAATVTVYVFTSILAWRALKRWKNKEVRA